MTITADTISVNDYVNEHCEQDLADLGWKLSFTSINECQQRVWIEAKPIDPTDVKLSGSGLLRRVHVFTDILNPRTEEDWAVELLQGFRPTVVEATIVSNVTLKDVSFTPEKS